jgi:hypothetical protein
MNTTKEWEEIEDIILCINYYVEKGKIYSQNFLLHPHYREAKILLEKLSSSLFEYMPFYELEGERNAK